MLGGSGFGSALGTAFKNGGIGAITGGVAGGIDAASDGRDFWSGAGESQHNILLSGGSGSQYGSNSEMRSDYNTNIGSRDGLSLEQVESKLNTNVSLAGDGNMPEGYSLNEKGYLLGRRGSVGGVTTGQYPGGFTNRASGSKIYMAPAVKGFDLDTRNGIFKHEFIHAWHLTIMPNNAAYRMYSERAAATFSNDYHEIYKMGQFLTNFKIYMGSYPSKYSYGNFSKLIPLWIK